MHQTRRFFIVFSRRSTLRANNPIGQQPSRTHGWFLFGLGWLADSDRVAGFFDRNVWVIGVHMPRVWRGYHDWNISDGGRRFDKARGSRLWLWKLHFLFFALLPFVFWQRVAGEGSREILGHNLDRVRSGPELHLDLAVRFDDNVPDHWKNDGAFWSDQIVAAFEDSLSHFVDMGNGLLNERLHRLVGECEQGFSQTNTRRDTGLPSTSSQISKARRTCGP